MGTISISPVKDGPLRPESAAVRVISTKKARPKNAEKASKAIEDKAQAKVQAQAQKAQAQATQAELDMQKLDETVSYANKAMQSLDRSLSFSVDEGTERVVVKVIDDSTGEIVRQIPPEAILKLAAHFKDMLESNQNSGGSTPIMLSVKT